ncbi:MAG: flagellar biosynthetic protein FliQ [Planctomycetota bacterium]|nr:flagellar biosynthetic protein FliQ [Planctomycetota bacterium]MEE3284511.1 flagellar biosynthetic protein FliQ [Planctomycetota bacterium]
MNSDLLTDAARQAVLLGLETTGPVLLVILVVGLVVGTLQAATQIQDQSVGFVVRLLAVVVALIVLLPWMLDRFAVYSADLFERIPSMI